MKPAADNIVLLRTACRLVEALEDEHFRSGARETSTVGRQFRHVVDFYDCFLSGLAKGHVDYTCRRRDRETERDRLGACREMERIAGALGELDDADCNRPIRVRLEGNYERDHDHYCVSSVMRELQFLLSHTVHHFTIIRALLSRHGVDLEGLDEHFGVAPSSVRHYQHAGS